MPLIVVVVGDRNQSQSQSQQGRRSCSKLQSCDYKSQTGLTWSYHQSEVLNSFLRLILLARPSATSRAISLQSSQNSNIFRSQLGRNMVVSPVWLRLKWLRVRIVPKHRDFSVENHSVCLFESDNHICPTTHVPVNLITRNRYVISWTCVHVSNTNYLIFTRDVLLVFKVAFYYIIWFDVV